MDCRSIIIYGLSGFMISIMIQSLVWNLINFKREMLAIILAGTLLPIGTELVLKAYFDVITEDFIYAVFLAYSLMIAYVNTYPALREEIPSVKVLNYLSDNNGVSYETIVEAEELKFELKAQKDRELENDRLVNKNEDRIELTKAGYLLAYLFKYYRDVMGIKEKTG